MKQIRQRVTYANVMSSIAVFLVLGGGAAIAAGLAKNSVGSKQLKKNAVTETKIKNGAVTSGKIADGSIVTAELADGSVVTGKIVNAAVTGDKLADGSVVTIKLADGSVTTAKLANDAVTAAKIAADSVGASEIAATAVGSSEIGPNSVGASELGDKIHEHVASGNAVDPTALDGDWDETAVITATCGVGEELIGVASTWTSGGDELSTQQLNPNFTAESVAGIGISDDGGTATFQVTAVCSS